ncbi:MAG: diguanylate cyclase [Thermodesulfobacteriota bacterium]|nr:diguanylate cyclase [Thermodesulfobacteriota bacterium]
MKPTAISRLSKIRNRLGAGIFRSTIARKIMLGYLPLGVVILFISIYTLSRLSELGALNMSIVEHNMAAIEADIDYFKSFNDRYGYARGNEVIKATGKIIAAALADHVTEEAFLCHIGGDDFAIIVQPDRYPAVCQTIINEFDKTIGDFYDEADRLQGYITARNRQGQVETFPVMTLSIAVVTNTGLDNLNSVRCGEIAAEIKEYAKTMQGSLFIADRRENGSQNPDMAEKEASA